MQQQDTHLAAAVAQLERSETYLAADPGNPHLLAAVIDQALAARQPERAARHAEAAVARYPEDDFLRARLGNARLAQQRWSDAADLFDALLARHADPALAYGAAYARYRQGLYQSAYDVLAPFAQRDDLFAAAATLLMRVLHFLGEPEQALALAAVHRPRCGTDAEFLAVASLAALDSGDLAAAVELSDAALAGGQRPAEALVTAGSLALGNLDEASAERLLNEVLASRPEEGRAWSALGMATLLRRDLPAARHQLETAVRFMPGHIGSWHSLGWCCLFAGDQAGARDAFATALDLDRNFGESHGGMAVVQALAGQRDEAQKSIERALGLDAQSLSARYAQMVLGGQTEDPQRFRQLALRIMQSRQGAFGQNLAEMAQAYEKR
ncbi:tetratricopeptide repeat protein [Pseudoduganella chitinolytica]|uniref:Tetratricopeptide repeat protein n=1 Tax=Pseudoduganella chitinolytica TaxID=34070 RepID=A0ABY8BD00_9BURK|nr:tetratricopeptide repeat protein [Pseudoduganella chitinolytica]WEF32863.1 tetratricopeptide repeat protein [Pseudoduganella chitinolytica]